MELLEKDGDVLVGTTVGYDLERPGFFVFPLGPKSNNLKLFAVSAAVKEVTDLTSAVLKS